MTDHLFVAGAGHEEDCGKKKCEKPVTDEGVSKEQESGSETRIANRQALPPAGQSFGINRVRSDPGESIGGYVENHGADGGKAERQLPTRFSSVLPGESEQEQKSGIPDIHDGVKSGVRSVQEVSDEQSTEGKQERQFAATAKQRGTEKQRGKRRNIRQRSFDGFRQLKAHRGEREQGENKKRAGHIRKLKDGIGKARLD